MISLKQQEVEFPPLNAALDNPNGLLAVGGELSRERLLLAYSKGIFPWYEEGQPILWWSPDPRAVVFTNKVHVSRSLRRTMRTKNFSLSMDKAFSEVVKGCAAKRSYSQDTWITEDMQLAYNDLFEAGHAHSIEIWQNDTLVGGLYGVAHGTVFSGESMFSRVPDASKIAFVTLCKQLHSWGWQLLDCQIANPHLSTLGAVDISREQFAKYLQHDIQTIKTTPNWQLDWQNTQEFMAVLLQSNN